MRRNCTCQCWSSHVKQSWWHTLPHTEQYYVKFQVGCTQYCDGWLRRPDFVLMRCWENIFRPFLKCIYLTEQWRMIQRNNTLMCFLTIHPTNVPDIYHLCIFFPHLPEYPAVYVRIICSPLWVRLEKQKESDQRGQLRLKRES